MSTYTKAKRYIANATEKDLPDFYDNIRNILRQDLVNYPEDWEIKTLQREADKRYHELLGEEATL